MTNTAEPGRPGWISKRVAPSPPTSAHNTPSSRESVATRGAVQALAGRPVPAASSTVNSFNGAMVAAAVASLSPPSSSNSRSNFQYHERMKPSNTVGIPVHTSPQGPSFPKVPVKLAAQLLSERSSVHQDSSQSSSRQRGERSSPGAQRKPSDKMDMVKEPQKGLAWGARDISPPKPGLPAPQPVRPLSAKPIDATLATGQSSLPLMTQSLKSTPSPGIAAARAAATMIPAVSSTRTMKTAATPHPPMASIFGNTTVLAHDRGRSPRRSLDLKSKALLSPVSDARSVASYDTAKSQGTASSQRTASSHRYREASMKDARTGLTELTLADAMVASSLASSRAVSPYKTTGKIPSPPVRQRSRSHSAFHHKKPPETGQKPRAMRRSLRRHKSDDDEDDGGVVKRGRHHLMRKHVHKHHEGDRKRWRDKITERERKRYEGIWAANRGLYTGWEPNDIEFGATRRAGEAKNVLNIVVRDIWDRSRLPCEVLEEIWDLVNETGSDTLSRDEFVVGLWLVDQRLKGRKLPGKVSLSVWASVRHSHGVNLWEKGP